MIRAMIFFALLLVADLALGQCNVGRSTQPSQVSANQQLVLQQTAALAAAQQAQANRTAIGRQVTALAPQLFQQAALAPQPAAAPPAPKPATPAPAFVRLTPQNATAPRAPDAVRYVLMSSSRAETPAMRLASR